MKTQQLKIWIGIIFNAFSLIVMAGSNKIYNPDAEFKNDLQRVYEVDSIEFQYPLLHFSKVDTSYHYIKIGTNGQLKLESDRINFNEENEYKVTLFYLPELPLQNTSSVLES